jgi:hypothetical protein
MLKKIKEVSINYLRILERQFRIKRNGTILTCPHCKSDEVKYEPPNVSEDGIIRREEYIVRCQRCNSAGQITEKWLQRGNGKLKYVKIGEIVVSGLDGNVTDALRGKIALNLVGSIADVIENNPEFNDRMYEIIEDLHFLMKEVIDKSEEDRLEKSEE